MKYLILLLLTTTYLYAQETLTFEQPNGTTSWTENGLTVSFVGGNDQIQTNQPYQGNGHGKTGSYSTSLLSFSSAVNISGMWLEINGYPTGEVSIVGYDINDNELYRHIITNRAPVTLQYGHIDVDLQAVSKIGFVVSPEMMPGAEPWDPGMEFPVDMYFDNIEYEISNISNTCLSPQDLTMLPFSNDSIFPTWLGESGTKYLMRYKPMTETDWIYSDTLTSLSNGPFTGIIDTYIPGTWYHWQVKAKCPNKEESIYSSLFKFKTECDPLFSGINYQASDSTITLSWPKTGNEVLYNLSYRKYSEPTNWTEILSLDTTYYVLSHLDPSTRYVITVQNQCYGGLSPYSSDGQFFSTLCRDSDTTFSISAINSYLAPDGQTLTSSGPYEITIPNSTDCDSTIYLDLTIEEYDILTFDQPSGTTSWSENGISWQFENGNGTVRTNIPKAGSGHGRVFSGEGTLFSASENIIPYGIWLQLLELPEGNAYIRGYDDNNGIIYLTEIDVNTFFGNYAYLPLDWGAVKKIGFSIPFTDQEEPNPDPMFPPTQIAATLNYDELTYLPSNTEICAKPSSPIVSFVNSHSAHLGWNDTQSNRYLVQYSTDYTNWSITDTLNTTSVVLNGLQPSSGYYWRVKSICATSESGYTNGQNFATICQSSQFEYPFVETEDSSMIIYWSVDDTSYLYNIEYRQENAPDWLSINDIHADSIILSNLVPAQNYELRLQTNCLNELGPFQGTTSFYTSCPTVNKSIDTTVIGQYEAPNFSVFNQSGIYNFNVYLENGCFEQYELNLTVIPVPQVVVSFEKDTYCTNNVADTVRAVASCQGFETVWYSTPNPSPSIVSTDSIIELFPGDTYYVRCEFEGIGGILQAIEYYNANKVSVANPNVTYNQNTVINGLPAYEHCQGAEDLSFNASCSSGNLAWVGTEPILGQSFRPDEVEIYNVFCLTPEGCSSDTLSYTWSFYEPTHPEDKPAITPLNENYACSSAFTYSSTGCTSGSYFGFYFDKEGNKIQNSWSGIAASNTYIIVPDTSVYYYTGCYDDVNYCPSTLLDSFFIDLENIPTIAKPEITFGDYPFCNKTGYENFLNNACEVGFIRWEKFNPTLSEYEEIELWNADFNEGDTLALLCRDGLCRSDTINLVVDFTPLLDKPEIKSKGQVFCENYTAQFSTSSCNAPNLYPEWTVFNDENSGSGYVYYDTLISVNIIPGVKISLKCTYNGYPPQCSNDTTLLLPKIVQSPILGNFQLSKDTLCPGEDLTLSYSILETLPAGNQFKYYLTSNTYITTPFEDLLIGTSTSSNQNQITLNLPDNLPVGSQYKIKVVPTITNLGPGELWCYESDYFSILGDGALNLTNNNYANCAGTELSLSNFGFFPSYGIDLGIKYFKNGTEATTENEWTNFDKYYKRFAESDDEGYYHAELTYNSCTIKSDSILVTFTYDNKPPTINDTTVSRQRGSYLDLQSVCENSALFSFKPYTFYSLYPNTISLNPKLSSDTTVYVACSNFGCVSDTKMINVSIFDPPGAPEPPVLTTISDTVCINPNGSISTEIVVSGCSGTLEWSLDNNFSDIWATQNTAPYIFNTPFPATWYARCTENDILSKGISAKSIVGISTTNQTGPDIPGFEFNWETQSYQGQFGLNTLVSIYLDPVVNDPYGNNSGYCSNGIVRWYDMANNFIGSGFSNDTTSSSAAGDTVTIKFACETAELCDFQLIPVNIVATDTLMILTSQNLYSVCGSGSLVLKANGCLNANTKWYSDTLSGFPVYAGNEFSLGFLENTSGSNDISFYYVRCELGGQTSNWEEVKVVVSPVVTVPSISDTLVACNLPVVNLPLYINECSNDEELLWKTTSNINYWHKEEFFRNIGVGNIINYNNSNEGKEYIVKCRNTLSFCESPVDSFKIEFDCSPPPPPIIEIQNQTTSVSGGKDKESGGQKGITIINEFCVGEQVVLNAQNCENGTIFWNDGYVGSPRNYPVKDGYVKLVANCKTDNLLKSPVSNTLEFQSKPTPSFTAIDTLLRPDFVNLTADSITSNENFPNGTVLEYYGDQNFSITLQNPALVSQSGKYFIKAEAPNGCFAAESVTVIIDPCQFKVELISNADDYNTGIILKQTNKEINAQNKVTGTARTTYNSGTFILLKPGFEGKVSGGGVFEALIGGCEN